MGRPLEEVLATAESLAGETTARSLSADWLYGEEWGKCHDAASGDHIRVFGNAIGDDNPLWSDDRYATNTHHGGIIAPPLYPGCIAPGWGATPFRRVDDEWHLAISGYTGFNAGSRWQRCAEIRPGDTFDVQDRFRGVEPRQSRHPDAPPMYLFEMDRSYIDQRGRTVAVCRMRMMALATAAGQSHDRRPPNVADISETYIYTDEEIEGIIADCAAEVRRGSNPRYFEEVTVGERLPMVTKGPVVTQDAVAFMSAVGLMQRAYGLRFRTENPSLRRRNPEDNTRAGLHTMHVYDAPLAGRTSGRNTPTIPGALVETWFAHLLTNWMGDDGFLVSLDSQHRRVARFRDTYRAHGSVTGKRRQDGKCLVDLELWTENQEAIRHSIATATVELPSRSARP